ncbi:hypothetical protein [Mesobacterium pallidum]|uniref:hypothetical protein n=1 Tax=Mesobacterium pallidum TaxID=2872037 RepID=UPI001EE38ABC|nr:hypothetical protein [Mesobacterium pallidum]
MSGASALASGRTTAQAQQNDNAAVRSQPVAQTDAAAPTYTADALTQARESEATRARLVQDKPSRENSNQDVMLRSQTLSNALAEEMRLQQKLADLRETIEKTEEELRMMQTEQTDFTKH